MNTSSHSRKKSPLHSRFTVLFTVLFAMAGVIMLVRSTAITPTAQLELEQGIITTPAFTKSDTTASGGSAVRFNAAASPSGEAMPVGDLPGWKQTFTEDFKADATASTFDSTYANSWCGYADGTGGKYYKVVTASGGMQHFVLDGTKGAAGSYGPPGSCWGSLYGKYTMRFKVTGASGYGSAIMLWSSSNVWGDGEVDYPEGSFTGTMHMYQHGLGCTDCSANIASVDTGQPWTNWHTTSVEWTPSGVSYYLDGALLKTVTAQIPINNHRWTIQKAPISSPTATGTFDVDWVTSYTYSP